MRCPRCTRDNPPRAERCDCGYEFPPGLLTGSYLTWPAALAGDAAAVARTYDANIIAHRLGAVMIDSFVGVVYLAPLYLVMEHRNLGRVLTLATAALVAYFVVLEGGWGVTFGKLVMGLRVVDRRGRAPGFARALIRTLVKLVEVNPLLAGLPAGVIALRSKTRRRLGDMLAGTYVLYATDVRRLGG
jgi:uncharacterized RDD family membrane protein YckC